ncbi:RNA 2',3'-cyclic phosphodiesterase [Raoultibacter phocaeensis]|uniref:RNA 2',3'-cyclic phosphodiesterase n=1 Tax=Raoultibacter phocaeensis TaxID=2479841 RepID=UPI00111A73C9|nr:RNA 2',3'-cyclic phosphodiesterase [Raoultibacter phocaeensis]
MRTFIALELPPDFASDIAAISRRLKPSIEGRFLFPESYHLTLAFLGDTSETDLACAIDAIDVSCTNIAAIPLRSDGLGKFGRANDATLWLGIAPAPELMQLSANIREELAARAVPFDGKPFKPHITFARRARIPKADLPPLAFPQDDEATAVTLFRSTLGRDGAAYKPLHSVELAAGRP